MMIDLCALLAPLITITSCLANGKQPASGNRPNVHAVVHVIFPGSASMGHRGTAPMRTIID